MKLDPKTTVMLNNFSVINPSILFKEGNIITTISPTKTILARAKVPNSFAKRFAIYNLSSFLGAISLVKDHNLSFGEKYVTIESDEGTKINFTYSSEETIKTPPEKDIVLPSIDVSFKLTDKVLKEVIKGAGVLQLPEIAIVGDGNELSVQAVDSKNPSSNIYNVKVDNTDKNFRVIFKTENIIKLFSGDYDVSISSKGISHFKGNDAEYWIAVEQTSTYNG